MRLGARPVNEWMLAHSRMRHLDTAIPFPWLTVECALWGVLLIIALGLRLAALDAAPLNSKEAQDALAALRFAQGHGAPTTTGYSPALFSAQWLTFLIVGANEFTARLLPSLAGTALALTPGLLRSQLGRLGALIAGALIALSPTAVTLSRTASGDVLVALGALLTATGLWHLVENKRGTAAADPGTVESATGRYEPAIPPVIYLIPFGIALMLASSPLAYSALIALSAAFVLGAFADPTWRQRLRSSWNFLSTSPNVVPYALGVLFGSLAMLSAAFGWHFGGLGAMADLLPQWLRGFVRWSDSLSLGYPALILVFYEPLILFLGLVGIVRVVLQGNAMSLFLALWSIGAFLLSLIRPGRGPGDMLLVVVPLAGLAGLALAAYLREVRRRLLWLNEGLYLVVSLPLWAFLMLNLATYSSRSAEYSYLDLVVFEASIPTFLSVVIATGLLLFIVAVGIGLLNGSRAALRSAAFSITLALLIFTIATTWGVSQNHPADPRELLVLEPTARDVRLLKESLTRISAARRDGAHGIDLTVFSDDPVLSWELREFIEAQFADAAEGPAATSAVVGPKTSLNPPLGEGYVGQSFPLRRRWGPDSLACRWNDVQIGFDQVRQLDCSALIKWLIFRRSPDNPIEERVVLWLRQDLVGW